MLSTLPLEARFWHVAFTCAARDLGKCFMFDIEPMQDINTDLLTWESAGKMREGVSLNLGSFSDNYVSTWGLGLHKQSAVL